MQRILFVDTDGKVKVFVPAPDYAEAFGVDELARVNVPHNAEYWIVDAADVPEDRGDREALLGDRGGLGKAHGKGGPENFLPVSLKLLTLLGRTA